MGQVRYTHDDQVLGKAYDPRIVRRLLGFLRPYRQKVLLAVGLVLLATLADLAMPLLFKAAVDETEKFYGRA